LNISAICHQNRSSGL